MNNIIKGLLPLLFVVSCEKIVEYPTVNNGRIHVNAVIGHDEIDRIIINVSQPVIGYETASAEDVTVSLKADERDITLERDTEYQPENSGEISYLIKERLLPGQELKLKASNDILPQVEASTIIPKEIGNVKISSRIANVYREKDNYTSTNGLRSLREFEVTVENISDSDNFYGIHVCKKTIIDTIGKVPGHRWENYKNYPVENYENFYVNSQYNGGISVSSVEAEMIIDFIGGDMRVISSSKDEEKSTAKVYIEINERKLWESMSGTMNDIFEIYKDYEYNIIVYRLSPELYYYLRSEYIKENSYPNIEMGFNTPSYVYTNVDGGLGIFGAVIAYDSGWFKIE